MKPLKLIWKCSKYVICDKVLLHQSVKNTLRSKSINEITNFNSYKPHSKQAQLESHRLELQRHASTESHKNIPICISELQRLLKKGNYVLIDVRNEDETWRTGVIPGSLCVPILQLESALKMTPEHFLKTFCREKPKVDDHIIFVCKRGNRSFIAAKKAKEMGYEKVHSMQGGFIEWLDRQRRIRELRSSTEELDCDSDEK